MIVKFYRREADATIRTELLIEAILLYSLLPSVHRNLQMILSKEVAKLVVDDISVGR